MIFESTHGVSHALLAIAKRVTDLAPDLRRRPTTNATSTADVAAGIDTIKNK
jgi:hypothetical protein